MSALRQRYDAQGFVSGIPVLAPAQVLRLRRHFERLEDAERAADPVAWRDPRHRPWEDPAHPLWRLFHALSTHPRVLAAVRSVLGPDLLIRNADVFIKEPGTREEIGWHLDTATPWPDSAGMINAWLGLTPSTRDNGGLWFIPELHRRHLEGGPRDKDDLTLSASAVATLGVSRAVCNVMSAGQMSLHAFRTPHRSGGNRSPDRRIGYVTRFVSAQVAPESAECGVAFPVSGSTGRFQPRPTFPVGWRSRSVRNV